jgi:hypothetical protein
MTLNWLIPLKRVYNNRDSFPSLNLRNNFTLILKTLLTNNIGDKAQLLKNIKNIRNKTQLAQKQLSIQTGTVWVLINLLISQVFQKRGTYLKISRIIP